MSRAPYARNVRHRNFDRQRYSDRLIGWLQAQAARLGTAAETVFNRLLNGESVDQVEALAGSYPVNTVAPAITGVTTVGSTLTAGNGTWTGNPAPSFSYQWNRNGVPIAGATAATYLLAAPDSGTSITADVTASNTLGSVTVRTAAVGPIT